MEDVIRHFAIRHLLADWIQAEATVISEYGGSITTSYQALIDDARDRAAVIGIEWDDNLVPDYISKAIGL